MKKKSYTCGCCGRRLKPDRWVYSSYTGNRYCWPGEGCDKRVKARRAKQTSS